MILGRSTQVAEGTPLERVQVVNSGARVQIPPSAFPVIGNRSFGRQLPGTGFLMKESHGKARKKDLEKS